MRVSQVNLDNHPSFGYKHPLKKMWKQGKLPTVKNGLYGNPLTKENCTIEHELPASQGGTTSYKNIALATEEANKLRGIAPITLFLTPEMAKAYLVQFVDVVVRKGQHVIFKGNEYIQKQVENLRKLGVTL